MEYILLNITTRDTVVVFRKKNSTWTVRRQDPTKDWAPAWAPLGQKVADLLEETRQKGLLTHDSGPLKGYEFRKVTEKEAMIALFTEPLPLIRDLLPLLVLATAIGENKIGKNKWDSWP